MHATKRPYGVIVSVVVLSLAAISIVAAQDPQAVIPLVSATAQAGSLITHVDQRFERLIVIDASKRRVVMYRIESAGLKVLAARDLDADLTSKPEQRQAETAAAPEPSLPAQDVPGFDVPGFPRLPGARRVVSGHSSEDRSNESWSATYWVAGTVPETQTKLLDLAAGWRTDSTLIEARPGWPDRGAIHLRKGTADLDIEVHRPNNSNKYVEIVETLKQPHG